ncbi:MAG: DNA-binding protein [Candidatus Diapherotrites archaeon]
MADPELEQIKAIKMEELQQQLAQQQAEAEKKALAEQRIELLLKKLLSPEAKARLKNVKLVNQELYWLAVQQVLLLFRAGHVSGQITEAQVKMILEKLSAKREIRIKRK